MPLRYLTAIFVAASLLAGCSKPPPTPGKPTETKPLTLTQLKARQTELLGVVRAGKRDERVAALTELPSVVSQVSGRTGGGASPPPPVEVVEAMGDPDPKVREAAAAACRRFHEETALTIEELTRQSDYKIEGTDEVATLASVLGRRSPVLRKAAADALGRIGPPAAKAIPALAAAEADTLRGVSGGRGMKDEMEVSQAVAAALKAIDPQGKVAGAAQQEAYASRELRRLTRNPNIQPTDDQLKQLILIISPRRRPRTRPGRSLRGGRGTDRRSCPIGDRAGA